MIFLVCLFLLNGCSFNEELVPEESPAVSVLAVFPEERDIPVYLEAIASLRASISAEIRPRINGTIDEIFVAEGQWVKTGDPLFKIEAASYEIKVKESLAKLQMDAATLKAAEKKRERYRSLADKDLVSQAEWDELEAAVEKAKAVVIADEASVQTASLDLSFCTLNACIDGYVGRLDVHPGLVVTSSQAAPLATIAKLDPLLVEFMISDKEYALVSPDKKEVEIICLHSLQCLEKGHITFVDNHYDSQSGLILIRGKVPNERNELRPGQSVKVRLQIDTVNNAFLIPQKAVKYNQEGPYVYVVDAANIVRRQKIQVGAIQESQIVVQEGLIASEQVITDGHMRIYPGSKVEIKE